MTDEHYDAVIIGSGQGGGPLAGALARAGRRTALIERKYVGGTCINEGCTPTKTMVASAEVAYLAGRAAEYGIETGPPRTDLGAVIRRKRGLVEEFRQGSTQHLHDDGVELVRGEAAFTGPHALRVTLQEGGVRDLTADIIVIDTGGRPAHLPIPGLDEVPALNSTTIMDVEDLPEHLLVLGGGYVGVEFGQMFRRFGSRVTIVQREDRLFGREDQDIADAMADILRQDGIEIVLSATTIRVEGTADGGIKLLLREGDTERHVEGSHLLVAIGRSPNTEALNVQAAGVTTDDRGFITVNDRLETVVPGIYALGDVAGSPAFTHISYDDGRILQENLLHGGNRSRAGRLVPYVVFTDPQLGRVGMSEEEARRAGRNIRVARLPMSAVARALEVGNDRGLVKAVVDTDTDRILGVAALGMEGGEVMAMLEIAMLGDLPYPVLRDGIFAHPTLSELFNNLFQNFEEDQ